MAVLSGVLLVLGFPPFDLYPVAWIALVPLLIAQRGKTVRTSFLLGMTSGMVYFMGTVYWVSHSMYFYGHLSVFISLLGMVLLSLYLSLFTGMFTMLFNFISMNSRVPSLFTVPVLWVTLEFLRTYLLTGFPWSILGYSQYRFLTLIQIADVTGVYGISFLAAAFSGAVYDVIRYRQRGKTGERAPARWPLISGILIYAVIITASILYGTGKLEEKAEGRNVKISVVQGNIPQDKKWDYRFQRDVIDTYKRLTSEAAADSPDIIIWPESAVPFIFDNDMRLTEDLLAFQKKLGAHLLFGSVTYKHIPGRKSPMANSAVLLSPHGDTLSVYDKIHLVPYGEYVPLRKFFPFIEKLTAGVGDFYTGDEATVMETPFAKIGNLICYEIIFPGLVRQFVNKGANMLVTITNDAWFGRTSAPYQHFSMAVLRAIENRVPVARSANTGISGFIDAKGRVIKKSDIFVEATLTEDLSVGTGKSFYTRYGDIFAYLCSIGAVFLIAGRLFIKKA